jgi:hypothetical protein
MKERAHQGGPRLNGSEIRLNAAAERFIPPQWGLADALSLEMAPDELVGVQLGRVAGQEMQLEATREALNRGQGCAAPLNRPRALTKT